MRKFLLAAIIFSAAACAGSVGQSSSRGLGQPNTTLASSKGNTTYGSAQKAGEADDYSVDPIPGGP